MTDNKKQLIPAKLVNSTYNKEQAYKNTEEERNLYESMRTPANTHLIDEIINKILVIDKDEAVIEVYNPTTFDLDEVTYSFSGNIEGIVDIEEREELNAYSYIRLTVKRKMIVNDTLNGYLDIYNYDENIANL